MPRVRILQSVAGDTFSWMPGEVIDMSAKDAAVWADGFRGELVRGEQPETPEQADGEGQVETTASKSRTTRTRKSG